MNPWLSQPPAIEPVTVAEAKTYLRIDHSDEDGLISSFITAARRFAEDYTRKALIDQIWSWSLDKIPTPRTLDLPRGPVLALTAFNVIDKDEVITPIDQAQLLISPRDGKLHLKAGGVWPASDRVAGGIVISWRAGYGSLASDVPAPIRQAILQLVAQMYQDRSLLPEGAVAGHPSVSLLLSPYRQTRL